MCSLKHQPLLQPLDVPDPVLRLLLVVALLDVEGYVAVVLLAALHLAEDDAPYAYPGGLLLDRVDPHPLLQPGWGGQLQPGRGGTCRHLL